MRIGSLLFWLGTIGLFGCASGDEPDYRTPTPSPTPSPTPPPTPTPVPFEDPYLSLGQADLYLDGEVFRDRAGTSLSMVGDLNDDGFDELAIGAPLNDDREPDAGKVYVYFGGDETLSSGSLSDAPASLQGEGRGDLAGQSVLRGGDLNGDGLDDLIIGAPYNDLGGTDAGRIYVVFGRTQGWYQGFRLANADASFYGVAGERVGELGSVGAGGDLNGDGYSDLAVGAPFSSPAGTESGRVYVVLGRESGWQDQALLGDEALELQGSEARDWAGFGVALVPDVNGDGYDELLIGAPHASSGSTGGGASGGRSYLFLGRASLPTGPLDVSSADVVLRGVVEGEESGCSVAPAGDVDGDGLGDLLIGAWGNGTDGYGRFYVVPGSTSYQSSSPQNFVLAAVSMAWISGSGPKEYLGRPGLTVGDVDGDGFDDFLLGSSLHSYAALVLGRASGWQDITFIDDADYFLLGEVPQDEAGYAVGGGGDLNGDGRPELLVGAPGRDTLGYVDTGRAYVFLGGSHIHP